MGSWPANVGIVAVEFIFPSLYVDQTELEKYDGVSAGKYTIGLGQSKMGFCNDREDVHSLCLTVVHKLLERHNISFNQIGRLDVGTETLLDKSKSVKSVLMQLFEPHGATDIEGLDTTNACYGGTAALFNAIAWVESSAWDGRYALVVAGDIAEYAKGSARPTGGAGAVAMLIGPNAPLVFDRHVRSTFMRHVYDFYKPDLSSEFPIFDGKLSIQCYLSALDNCYQLHCKKSKKIQPDSPFGLEAFDAILFHSPYCKLVQKSLARLVLNDFLQTPLEKRAVKYPGLEQYNDVKLEESYFDTNVEKAFMKYSQHIFESKTKGSLLLANQIGNMYTPSLYGCLVSLLVNESAESLAGKKIGLFSYGSGLASSMFSISITKEFAEGSPLEKLTRNLSHIKSLLEKRIKVDPEQYTEIIDSKETRGFKVPYKPTTSVENFFPGTYYLESVDELHRRTYLRVPN